MRLREREKQRVWLYTPEGPDDDVYFWGDPTVIRAAVYPAGGELDARVYGERARDMRLLLYDGGEALATGMGVSLSGGAPEYRIVSMEGWSHQRALLERIPEGRRGDVGV